MGLRLEPDPDDRAVADEVLRPPADFAVDPVDTADRFERLIEDVPDAIESTHRRSR